MLKLSLAGKHFEANSLQTRRRTCEVRIDQFPVQPDGFENLRSLIALQGRDTHLGESLQQTFVDRLSEVLHREFGSYSVGNPSVREFSSPRQAFDALQCQIRIDGASPIAAEERKVHHLARFARFRNQRNLSSSLLLDQQVVHGGQRQQAGDGSVILIHATIGKNEQRVTGFSSERCALAQLVERTLQSGFSFARTEQRGQRDGQQIPS